MSNSAKVVLGGVDKFDPITRGCEIEHSKEAIGELVVPCGDGTVDLEMAEHPFDAVALAVKTLVVADHLGAV